MQELKGEMDSFDIRRLAISIRDIYLKVGFIFYYGYNNHFMIAKNSR